MSAHSNSGFDSADTHEVINQATPREGYNAFEADDILKYWLKKFDAEWGNEKLTSYGELVGNALQQAGFLANKHKPEFESHNRFGHRIDQVNYHPSYHELMHTAIAAEHHSAPWTSAKPGANIVRAALAYLHTQADPGSGCPLTMTFACIPTIKQNSKLADYWLPKILSKSYAPENKPYFEKDGVTIGMAMTEKQGGSDVRANTTHASFLESDELGDVYQLMGHKWFCSAPMCDAFLMLAQTEEGLSCFLVPRWRSDGSKNPIHIQRLKDKLGNVSNASSEIELRGAHGWLVGDLGKGVRSILQMVALTRFDCMMGSTSIMMQAAQEAIHHTSSRMAFGKTLSKQPIMENVLADLALEAEAALSISMRTAHALDHLESHENRSILRLGTAIGKYWICKRAAQVTYEAMECIGGVGIVKDNVTARLYAEAPVNAIWEGSGNVQCLDILRAIHKEPKDLENFTGYLKKQTGKHPIYDTFLSNLTEKLQDTSSFELQARRITEDLAKAWQAATLMEYGTKEVTSAFIDSRLQDNGYAMYGTLSSHIDLAKMVERARPKLTT